MRRRAAISLFEVSSMAEFSVISASQAPPMPHKKTPIARRMAQYEGYVLTLKCGSAGKLVPERAETPRALLVRIRRAAGRVGRPVEAWQADGVVYFRAAR
jgi:hypothetical protein